MRTRRGYYVAFEGSWEDPDKLGAIAGPFPTLKYAREWVEVLNIAIAVCGSEKQKRPLYLIRVKERATAA